MSQPVPLVIGHCLEKPGVTKLAPLIGIRIRSGLHGVLRIFVIRRLYSLLCQPPLEDSLDLLISSNVQQLIQLEEVWQGEKLEALDIASSETPYLSFHVSKSLRFILLTGMYLSSSPINQERELILCAAF